MPFYELCLVLRPMPKGELVECLKRTANLLWAQNGVLRKLDNLGYQKLPFKAKGHEEGQQYDEGHYFVYHMSLPQLKLRALTPEFKLDVDIINFAYNETNDTKIPEDYECTLEEELQKPFYRPSVQPLLQNKNVRASVRRTHMIQDNKS